MGFTQECIGWGDDLEHILGFLGNNPAGSNVGGAFRPNHYSRTIERQHAVLMGGRLDGLERGMDMDCYYTGDDGSMKVSL